jgi:hypothetical protein
MTRSVFVGVACIVAGGSVAFAGEAPQGAASVAAAAPAKLAEVPVRLIHGQPEVGLKLHALPLRFKSIREAAAVRKGDSAEPEVEAETKSPLRAMKEDLAASEAAKAGIVLKNTPSSAFDAGGTSWDPAIAVGEKAILVISDHWISYYGRDGKPLATKNGEATSMSADDFFKIFWQPTLPDGTSNPNNINKFLDFPSKALKVDTTKEPFGQTGAIEEWYDSRCAYDPVHKRFFFLSAERNHLWFNDPTTNPSGKYDGFVRRFFAFAVSKTEDPRDGWYYWSTTSSNYADWPRMAVSNGMLTVAHNSPEAGKPFAYVFDESDLLAGHSNPGHFAYYAASFPGAAKVLPVSVYGSSGGWSYFVGVTKPTWNPVEVFGLTKPSSFSLAAPLKEGTAHLGTPLDFQIENPKLRNGKLYFASNLQAVPDRLHVRVVRMPIKASNAGITLGTSGSGFMDYFFGKNGPGDAPGDLVSYVRPAIAINKDDNGAIVYGRFGVTTAKPLFPEARYSLLYGTKSKTEPSVLIRKGEFKPSMSMTDRLDLVNATIDPKDDKTLWLCHAYAKQSTGDYEIVVTSVKP